MQARTRKNTLGVKLLIALLAITLVFTMMPLSRAYAATKYDTEQTEWDNTQTALTVNEKTYKRDEVVALGNTEKTFDGVQVTGVLLSTLLKDYSADYVVSFAYGDEEYSGQVALTGTVSELGDYLLAYKEGDKDIFQNSKKSQKATPPVYMYGCFNLYAPDGTKEKMIEKIYVKAPEGSGGNGSTGETFEGVTVKGNVLKKEMTVKKEEVSSILKENIQFLGINKHGNASVETVTGVTIEDLVQFIGLKDGATIESFEVTTTDGYPAGPYNAEWLLSTPQPIANLDQTTWTGENVTWEKAMLGFSADEARLYLGSFEGIRLANDNTKTPGPYYPNSFANKPSWASKVKTIEVKGTISENGSEETPGSIDPTNPPKDTNPPTTTVDPTSSADKVVVGQKVTRKAGTFVVTSAKKKNVAFTKAKNKKSVVIPATVKINGKKYKVTRIKKGAFKAKKIRTVTVGKNVKKIDAYAFKSSKTTKVILKTKLLKKSSVKGSLKKSKVKTIKVKLGSKKLNTKYVKKYKKYFTKKNAGKKVTVTK